MKRDFAEQDFSNDGEGGILDKINDYVSRNWKTTVIPLSLFMVISGSVAYKSRVPIEKFLKNTVNRTRQVSNDFSNLLQEKTYNIIAGSSQSIKASEQQPENLSQVEEVLEGSSERNEASDTREQNYNSLYEIERVQKAFKETIEEIELYEKDEIKESDLEEVSRGIAKWSEELGINPILPISIVMQEAGWANINDSNTAKGYFQIEDRPGLRVDKDLFNRVSHNELIPQKREDYVKVCGVNGEFSNSVMNYDQECNAASGILYLSDMKRDFEAHVSNRVDNGSEYELVEKLLEEPLIWTVGEGGKILYEADMDKLDPERIEDLDNKDNGSWEKYESMFDDPNTEEYNFTENDFDLENGVVPLSYIAGAFNAGSTGIASRSGDFANQNKYTLETMRFALELSENLRDDLNQY